MSQAGWNSGLALGQSGRDARAPATAGGRWGGRARAPSRGLTVALNKPRRPLARPPWGVLSHGLGCSRNPYPNRLTDVP